MSYVRNEVLPLLKRTFGGNMSIVEGEKLESTLGDPNASPGEKDAALRAFILSKTAEVQTAQRRIGQTPSQYVVGQIVTGPDGKDYKVMSLKKDGTPDEVEPTK